MRLWSEAFRDGEQIPLEYTKDGWNKSPPFRWGDLPSSTRELALIFEGVTPANHDPWVHWLAYKIPADAGGLPSGYKHEQRPQEPAPLFQGSNSLGNVGYDGPQGMLGRKFRYRIRQSRSTRRSRRNPASIALHSRRRSTGTCSAKPRCTPITSGPRKRLRLPARPAQSGEWRKTLRFSALRCYKHGLGRRAEKR